MTETRPTAADLRDRLAADLYERANPGLCWADAHPDDLLAYGDDADRALATQALGDLQQRVRDAEAAVARAHALATRWAVLRAYGGAATELRAALAEPKDG